MSSIDRLIDLAQQTGSRLIIHDPIEGRDVVIMDVDEYEKLVFSKKENRRDVCGMSSNQLLDQINRDIAVWRANEELDERWEREEHLEEELMGDELDKVFGDDYNDDWRSQPEDWRSAGSVLRNRYAEHFGSGFMEDEDVEIENEDEEDGEENFDPSIYKQFGADSLHNDLDFDEFNRVTEQKQIQSGDEIKIDDVPDFEPWENSSAQVYPERSQGTQSNPSTRPATAGLAPFGVSSLRGDSDFDELNRVVEPGRTQGNPSAIAQGKEEPKNIPYQNFLGETEWKEEPLLEEEPVFYEEQV